MLTILYMYCLCMVYVLYMNHLYYQRSGPRAHSFAAFQDEDAAVPRSEEPASPTTMVIYWGYDQEILRRYDGVCICLIYIYIFIVYMYMYIAKLIQLKS